MIVLDLVSLRPTAGRYREAPHFLGMRGYEPRVGVVDTDRTRLKQAHTHTHTFHLTVAATHEINPLPTKDMEAGPHARNHQPEILAPCTPPPPRPPSSSSAQPLQVQARRTAEHGTKRRREEPGCSSTSDLLAPAGGHLLLASHPPRPTHLPKQEKSPGSESSPCSSGGSTWAAPDVDLLLQLLTGHGPGSHGWRCTTSYPLPGHQQVQVPPPARGPHQVPASPARSSLHRPDHRSPSTQQSAQSCTRHPPHLLDAAAAHHTTCQAAGPAPTPTSCSSPTWSSHAYQAYESSCPSSAWTPAHAYQKSVHGQPCPQASLAPRAPTAAITTTTATTATTTGSLNHATTSSSTSTTMSSLTRRLPPTSRASSTRLGPSSSLPAPTPPSPPSTCTDFALYLSKLLGLHTPSTVQLALHCWRRVQKAPPTLQLVAAWRAGPVPGQRAMIGACLWLSAKLEEQRKVVPSTTQLAARLGASTQDVQHLELQVGVCVYVCVPLCMHACMCVSLHACVYVCVSLCMRACMCVSLCMRACMCVRLCACASTPHPPATASLYIMLSGL